ncbi:MAG: hypothetical protein KDC92_13700, partial [Bacteroidetes bacterium]|nr:hypothetical protein [Bacteroidota bacterium]
MIKLIAFLAVLTTILNGCTAPEDCADKRDFVEIKGKVNNQSEESIYLFYQFNCQVFFDNLNSNFKTWYYFSDGAGNSGTTALDAFEVGTTNYAPTLNASADEPHHFDIRHVATG